MRVLDVAERARSFQEWRCGESYTSRASRTSRQGEGVAIVRKLIDLFRGVLACADGREQGLAV